MRRSIFRWERDFARTVSALAAPIMLQSLFSSLMYILDNWQIGQLGQAQLAGVTQANRIAFLFQIVMYGLTSGTSIFTAQLWGKRDIKGIHELLGLGFVSAAAVALLFAAFAICAPGFLMNILIQDAEAAGYGARYLRVIGFAYLLQAVLLVEEATLKSTEQVRLPMAAGIIAIATNAALNYVLIFGKFGFPRLEVTGGALATAISIALQLAIVLGVSYKNRFANAVPIRELCRLPGREVTKRFYKTVAPVVLNETLWSSGQVMFSIAYGRMGPAAVAALSIFSNIEQLTSVTMRGMTGACAVLVGKTVGADEPEEAQLIAKRMLVGNIALAVLVGALIALFAGRITSLFNVPEETKLAARQLIDLYAFIIWMSAANGTLIVGIMRSGGDVLFSGVLDVLFLWTISVPLVFFVGLRLGWPVPMVYLLARTEDLIKMGVGVWRVASGKWIHNLVS